MIKPVVYVGDARYSFQGSTPAEVVRIVLFRMDDGEDRLALHLRYPDGREDFAPLKEAVDRGFICADVHRR